MTTKINTLKTYLLLFFLLATLSTYSQIVLNTSPNTATCNLNGALVTVSVPSEILTGDNIALNVTLPGSFSANCEKTVTITHSSNLVFQSSGGILFTPVSGNPLSYENDAPLPGNDGQNFNVFFKFPPYTTCNGTVGTFDITVTLDCNGTITTCTTSVSVIARADNYWTITKEFVTGDLTCGVSVWRIRLNHNNPNGAGLGTYKITGTITENPTVPVISGASFTINNTGAFNGSWPYTVSLRNCAPNGSTITNAADYNLTLGNGCETMIGTVTETSPPLSSPNASISFQKTVSSPYYTNLTPGCEARYFITVCNNGNVPWTNLSITDDLNIPGITITNISIPTGWTSTPAIPPYSSTSYTFTAPPGFVLNPGMCKTIYIEFQIDAGATIGSTISNTAYLNYQAATSGGGNNGGGSSGNNCPGINCPTINSSVQNTSDSVSFVVENPKAIASIKKCILDPPNTLHPPIYQIGDTIKYSVMIGNSGAGDLSTTINDAMGMPNQNLQIIPSSINYAYYANQSSGYKYSCNPYFGGVSPTTPPFSVVADTTDLQNPTWTISNMPGICDLYKSNYLIVEFEAIILPQLYGTKTNRARIPNPNSNGNLSSAVNYSIDQTGILAVTKSADAEIVENGQTFNYIITVTNNGSVPLDHILVTDTMPSCVSLNGHIDIESGVSNTIPYTTSGNLILNVNPTTQLQPGDSFTITVPVIKSGGGNCCNESVSVTAEMVTSQVALNANYGSAEAPAACVTGTECCDIQDFEASISENNGQFNVLINGGSVPLQEVEISMIDYHVSYSNDDCKPTDMGTFGTISTTTNMLGNLLFNSSDNNTSSLSWLLGNPSIINNSVNLDIVNPQTLNLDCCDVTFSFCLKVRVKDVNCNVCEKTICYTSGQQNEPKPCDLSIKELGQDKTYCPGDTVTLNWSGSSSSGLVNVLLFDNTNGTVQQTIATNISDTGTFTFTIPSNIPCDPPRTWSVIVESTDKECTSRSSTFVINCCQQQTTCDCGDWATSFITIKKYNKEIPKNPKVKINIDPSGQKEIQCGGEITLNPLTYYSFSSPTYICNPENCEVTYKWKVVNANGIIESGIGQTFNHNFSNTGTYQVIFTPICGNKRCKPCVITVFIEKQGIGH